MLGGPNCCCSMINNKIIVSLLLFTKYDYILNIYLYKIFIILIIIIIISFIIATYNTQIELYNNMNNNGLMRHCLRTISL